MKYKINWTQLFFMVGIFLLSIWWTIFVAGLAKKNYQDKRNKMYKTLPTDKEVKKIEHE